jgi:hypothetical protein
VESETTGRVLDSVEVAIAAEERMAWRTPAAAEDGGATLGQGYARLWYHVTKPGKPYVEKPTPMCLIG